MERISHWLAWIVVFLIVAFAGLNWGVLTTPTSLNLLVADISAPVGIILLGLTAVFVLLFFVATLYTRISNLLEGRQMNKELARVQQMADKAEASRMENLHKLVSTEFRLVNERLSKIESLLDEPLVKLP